MGRALANTRTFLNYLFTPTFERQRNKNGKIK